MFSLLVSNGMWWWSWFQARQLHQNNQLLLAEQQRLRSQIYLLDTSIQALELPLAGSLAGPFSHTVDLPSIAAANLIELKHVNQQYQLAILSLEKRIQKLTFERNQMQRELSDLQVEQERRQAGWLTLSGLLGYEVNTDKKVNQEALAEEAWQKLSVMQQLPAGWPLKSKSRLTSAFGMRMHPIEKVRKKHYGVDLSCQKSEPIIASAPGVVSISHYSKGFGHQVTILHNAGFRSRYAHLQQRQAQVGDVVAKGQVIGLCGQSGLANGPNLHYEVRYLTTPLNPTLFINWQLDQFDQLLTKTGKQIPWPFLLKQIASQPRLVKSPATALPLLPQATISLDNLP